MEGKVAKGLEQGEWLGEQDDTIVWALKDCQQQYAAITDSAGRKLYTFLDSKPQFKGGIEGFFLFIARNIRYPALASEHKIVGRVEVSCVVGEDGKLGNIKVVKSPSPVLSEEAIRVIKLSPAWQPGTLDVKQVPMVFNFPIQFSISE